MDNAYNITFIKLLLNNNLIKDSFIEKLTMDDIAKNVSDIDKRTIQNFLEGNDVDKESAIESLEKKYSRRPYSIRGNRDIEDVMARTMQADIAIEIRPENEKREIKEKGENGKFDGVDNPQFDWLLLQYKDKDRKEDIKKKIEKVLKETTFTPRAGKQRFSEEFFKAYHRLIIID